MRTAKLPNPNRRPIRCACTNLKMAARAVGRLYDEALEPAGLNSTQYAILTNCGPREEVPKMDLARKLMIDRTTLYRAIAVLERRGLVASRRAGKGREEVLTLTDTGEALVAAAEPKWEAVQRQFNESFGGEWDQLLVLVRRAQKAALEAQIS